MPQYLVAIQHPENYDPSPEGEAMVRDIGALNEQMDAAGARLFAGGLESARFAKSLRKQPDGKVSITDGPFTETKEHIGGFWILECADMEEALAWDAKPSSPAGFLSRCGRFSKSGPKEKLSSRNADRESVFLTRILSVRYAAGNMVTGDRL